MKLSEILEYAAGSSEDNNQGGKYLVFLKCYGICITIVKNLGWYKNSLVYKVKNPEEVNLKYVYYYFMLHKNLLREPGSKKMDHLNVEFINNIELPSWSNINAPNIDMQNMMANILRGWYKIIRIDYNKKISRVFLRCYNLIFSAVSRYGIIKNSEFCRVTNKEKFFKNIKNCKLRDPIEDYIEILKPELLNKKFLVYYLCYGDQTNNPIEFCISWYASETFNTDNFDIKVPSIGKQESVVKEIDPIHGELQKLITEKRNTKLNLRTLVCTIHSKN